MTRTPIGTRPFAVPAGQSRRLSPLFLAIAAICATSGVMLWRGVGSDKAGVFLFVLSGWLLTLCFHEFAHALAAYRGGDLGVAGKGYLTLNPLRYGHPAFTLLIPLIALLYGGIPLPGGAVGIDSQRLRSRARDSLVSACGPLVNVVFAAILLTVTAVWGPGDLTLLAVPHAAFWAALSFLGYLQVATAILNLLPVPGLDGYGIVEPALPHSWQRSLAPFKPYGMILVFAVLFSARFGGWFSDLVNHILSHSHQPLYGAYWGFHLFRFWEKS